MTGPRDEELRESFGDLIAEARVAFLALAHRNLADLAKEQGIPEDEAATPEAVYEEALALFHRSGGDQVRDVMAGVTEFFTDEERRRIYAEEEYRLSVQYPEGVPPFVLTEAIIQRMRRARPEGDF